MALYEYRCPDGHTVEVFHKMDEEPEVSCPVCGARAERVISTPMIHNQYYYSTQVRQSRFPRHRSSSGPDASPATPPPPPASTESSG
ncbi:MAG: FmdB family zinc ribbon protein [Solirubrobacteraceae bacterium]